MNRLARLLTRLALLGALLGNGYRSAIDDKLDGIPMSAADTAREGIANAVEVAPETGSHAQDLIHAAQQSFVDGWRQAMWIGAAVMGVLLVYVALRGPKNTTPVETDEEVASTARATENVAAR